MSDTRSRAGVGVAATAPVRLRYGDHADECIQYTAADRHAAVRDAAVMVYFDAAGWHPGRSDAHRSLAERATDAGLAFAEVHTSRPSRRGLTGLVDQARRAVDWIVTHPELGHAPHRVVVAGHSAGAHLAAMVAVHDPRPCGFVLVSGIYDLGHPGCAAHQREMGVTDDDVVLLSPLGLIGPSDAACVVAWADGDTPEVRRQGQAWATRWTMSHWNRSAVPVHVAGRDHVDVTHDLFDTDTPLGAAVRSILDRRSLDEL